MLPVLSFDEKQLGLQNWHNRASWKTHKNGYKRKNTLKPAASKTYRRVEHSKRVLMNADRHDSMPSEWFVIVGYYMAYKQRTWVSDQPLLSCSVRRRGFLFVLTDKAVNVPTVCLSAAIVNPPPLPFPPTAGESTSGVGQCINWPITALADGL